MTPIYLMHIKLPHNMMSLPLRVHDSNTERMLEPGGGKCRYISLRFQCKTHFSSTNLYAEMIQGRLFLMFVVHIVMFVSTNFCTLGPNHKCYYPQKLVLRYTF